MERIWRRLRGERPSPAAYDPLPDTSLNSSIASMNSVEPRQEAAFSWIEYGVFTLLGVAMLWGWNMLLAAAPYFQGRFADSEWLFAHFQSAVLSVFNVTNVIASWLLAKLQRDARYPRRIFVALVLSMVSSTFLALSTSFNTSAEAYFVFLMAMTFITSLATAFCQNGLLAYASSFASSSEYTQAIMTGQGIAGVLPAISQIATTLSVAETKTDGEKPDSQNESPRSAFIFFMIATAAVGVTLLAFVYLIRQNPDRAAIKPIAIATENETVEDAEADAVYKVVGFQTLLAKLRWFALGVALVFMVTMVYPVFTQAIYSVRDPSTAPRLFQRESFIPLAFLVWNSGDLIGRLLCGWERISLVKHPKIIFGLAVGRIAFIPLYEMCNIKGKGAIIPSDLFYLGFVQLFFGMTGGYVGSTCMMAAPHWVDPAERSAAGGFMGLMLVIGLAIGSLMSFGVIRS